MKTSMATSAIIVIMLSGCSRLEFRNGWIEGGAHFRDPVPYFLLTVNKDCVPTGTIITVPGERQTVMFRSGYGSSNLSASFQNGMLASVGQQADSQIPQTISALSGLTSVAGSLARERSAEGSAGCPSATLFAIEEGRISRSPISLPIPRVN